MPDLAFWAKHPQIGAVLFAALSMGSHSPISGLKSLGNGRAQARVIGKSLLSGLSRISTVFRAAVSPRRLDH